jgi:cyclase
MSNLSPLRPALVILALVALPAAAMAQSVQPPLTMKQLKPDVWVGLGGAGGNSTIIIGSTSVIVVDAKQTEAGAKDLLAQIAKITPKPVSTVILTPSDGDHVNGLVAFPAGIKIIAHENNKKEQEAALAAGGRGAPPADRLPNEIVRYYAIGQGLGMEEERDMKIDGVDLELYHWGPGHTSGDLSVYLPAQKIVATGDIIVTNRADDNPIIHHEKNGSTDGWVWNVKGLIMLDAETYVPGHGDLAVKADLQRKLAATETRRAKIAAMVREGKTLEEIKAALPDAAAAGNAPNVTGTPGSGGGAGGRGNATANTFVDTVYAELTKK